MASTATPKQELLTRIERMSAEEAEELLDFLNMRSDPDDVTLEEHQAILKATHEFERAETVSASQLERELGIEL